MAKPNPGNVIGFSEAQPCYLAVARELAAEIARGKVAPGERLPGERELCRHFDVSRVTVRHALSELRDRGLIEPESARGWFVTSTVLGEPNALMSFSEMARSRGLIPSARILAGTVRPATMDEAEALNIAPGSEVFDLERLRLLDGVPVAIEQSRLPLAVAPALPGADLAAGSLYELLRQAGAVPARADYVLQAIPAEARLAKHLELPEGAPLLMATAKTYDLAGRAIELSRSIFRGDRYRFRATLVRTGREPGGSRGAS
jgi:DNA-binding GntR family transcriptional regulator